MVGNPGRDLGAGIVEIEEQGLVEQLVAHAAVEALDRAVLHRLAGRDEVPLDGRAAAPDGHGVRGELGSVVADDHVWLAMPIEDRRQLAPRAGPRSMCPGWRRGIAW